jgi:hypothetical protein
VSHQRLPLKNKEVLKQSIRKIGRANLPLNDSTRVCSEHFVNATAGEVTTLKLPILSTQASLPPPRRPLIRHTLPGQSSRPSQVATVIYHDAAINIDITGVDVESLERELSELRMKVQDLEHECEDLK